jgi:hypothetical protein
MLATLVDAPFHRPGWVWEEKYDGIRLIARKHGRRVELLTRNDKDRTDDFPDVVAALAALPAATLVVDGEVVVFDAGGVSRFQLLQRRGAGASSPVYVVFDCLHARGRDLTGEPLTARRAVLEAEVVEGPALRIARRLAADGLQAFAETLRVASQWLEMYWSQTYPLVDEDAVLRRNALNCFADSMAVVDAWLDRRLPHPRSSIGQASGVYIAIALIGSLFAVGVVATYLDEKLRPAGIALLVSGVATLSWWYLRYRGAERPPQMLRVLGSGGVIAAVVLGFVLLVPHVRLALGSF